MFPEDSGSDTTLLIEAVKSKNVAVVKYLLSIPGINVNCTDADYRSPLHHALFGEDETIFNLLINDNKTLKINMSKIIYDIHDNRNQAAHVYRFRRLLNMQSIDIQSAHPYPSEHGSPLVGTPIEVSIQYNRDSIDVTKEMLEHATTPKYVKRQALLKALQYKNFPIFLELLSTLENNFKLRRVLRRCIDGLYTQHNITIHEREIILHLIMNINIDLKLNTIYKKNKTLLMHICESGRDVSQFVRSLEAKLPFKTFMNILNYKNKEGNNALMCGLKNNDSHIDTFLQYAEIDLKCTNKKGNNALMLAVQKQVNLQTIDAFLKKEVIDINAQNNNGFTALMMATKNDDLPTVQRLLQIPSIDIWIQNERGDDAFCISMKDYRETSHCAHYFLQRKEKMYTKISLNKAFRICVNGDSLQRLWPLMNIFLKMEDIDLNSPNQSGLPPIFCFVNTKNHLRNLTCLSSLIKHPKLNINMKAPAYNERTALLHACKEGYYLSLYELLESSSIDVFAHDSNGKTAMDYCILNLNELFLKQTPNNEHRKKVVKKMFEHKEITCLTRCYVLLKKRIQIQLALRCLTEIELHSPLPRLPLDIQKIIGRFLMEKPSHTIKRIFAEMDAYPPIKRLVRTNRYSHHSEYMPWMYNSDEEVEDDADAIPIPKYCNKIIQCDVEKLVRKEQNVIPAIQDIQAVSDIPVNTYEYIQSPMAIVDKLDGEEDFIIPPYPVPKRSVPVNYIANEYEIDIDEYIIPPIPVPKRVSHQELPEVEDDEDDEEEVLIDDGV